MQQVPFINLNAGDTGNAWQAALPTALAWLWQQLAPPDLRVLFPVRTHATGVITLPVRPVQGTSPLAVQARGSPVTPPRRAERPHPARSGRPRARRRSALSRYRQ